MLASKEGNSQQLKLWVVKTGALKRSIPFNEPESALFLNNNIVVVTESAQQKGFYLYDLKTMKRNFHRTQKTINCLETTDNGFLLTGGVGFLRIWKIDGNNAEEMNQIAYRVGFDEIRARFQ